MNLSTGWDTESFDGSDDGDERDSESKQSFIVTSARDLDDEMRLPLPPPYDICVPPGSVICSKPSKELTSDADLRQSEGVVLWRRKPDHSPEVLGESSPMVNSRLKSFLDACSCANSLSSRLNFFLKCTVSPQGSSPSKRPCILGQKQRRFLGYGGGDGE